MEGWLILILVVGFSLCALCITYVWWTFVIGGLYELIKGTGEEEVPEKAKARTGGHRTHAVTS